MSSEKEMPISNVCSVFYRTRKLEESIRCKSIQNQKEI